MAYLDALLRRLITTAARAARNNPKIAGVIATSLLLWAGVGISVVTRDIDGNGSIDRVTIERHFKTVAVPVVGAPVVADTDQQQQSDELAEAARSKADEAGNIDVHEDTRDETPPGVSAAEIAAGKKATGQLADEILVKPEEPAGAQAYSCPAAYVRNQSGVQGRRVGTALHFTVSSPGSLPIIRQLFNTASFGASSNFGIELNGRCQTWVPKSRKAWAQGAANSAYFSIEIVTRDLTRKQWLAAPIIKRGILAALVRDLNRSVGAPLKHVNPSGCVWTPGIVDHDGLECGNSHWDVGKNFPWDVFIKQVRQGVEPTATDRSTCARINSWRRAGRPRGGVWHRATQRRLAALTARGITCTRRGPVR